MIELNNFISTVIVAAFAIVGYFLRDFHMTSKRERLQYETDRREFEEFKLKTEVWKTEVNGRLNLVESDIKLRHEHIIQTLAELKNVIQELKHEIKKSNNG